MIKCEKITWFCVVVCPAMLVLLRDFDIEMNEPEITITKRHIRQQHSRAKRDSFVIVVHEWCLLFCFPIQTHISAPFCREAGRSGIWATVKLFGHHCRLR